MTAEPFGVDPDYLPTAGTRNKVSSRGMKALVAIIGLNLLLVVLAIALDPRVEGPEGSSIVTTELGYGAWREVLRALEIPTVQLKVPLDDADLAEGARLVVVSPEHRLVDARYRRAVENFLDAGGTLITTPVDAEILGINLDIAVDSMDPSVGEVSVVSDLPDVSVLRTPGSYILGARQVLVETADQQAIVARSGGVVLLSDVSLLDNANLGAADNGVLAVRLAGTGPVYFDEYVHGFGAGQGLAGVPAGVISLVLILISTIVWMWAVGARFGPPEQPQRALPPPRAAYLDGIAATLAKAKPTEAGFGILRARAVALLDRQAERFGGAGPEDRRRRAAAALQITDAELRALEAPISSAGQVVHAAAVVAKIEKTRTGSAE